MPQVPLYSGPQVEARPLQYDQATDENFGAIQARSTENLGKGLMAAGVGLDRANEREVQTQVYNAEAKAKEAFIAWQQDAVKNRQGEAAKGIVKDAADWWTTANETYGKDLSPMAQRMLQRSLTQQSLAAKQTLGNFEIQQLEVANDVARKTTTDASINSAVENPSDANLNTQRQNILGVYNALRPRFGDAVVDTMVRGELSKMHVAVFNRMFVDNPAAAKIYYETHQKEIDGNVKDNILERLKQGIADAEGGAAARDEFTTMMRGKGLNDAIPVDQIDAKLVQRFGSDPVKLKAARGELDRQVALRNAAQNEANAGAVEGVYGQFNRGVPLAKVLRSAEWSALPARTQQQIQQQVEDRAHALQVRNVEDRARRLRMIELEAAPEMLRLSDPEVLSNMTPAEIRLMAPTIGYNNAAQLLQTWQSYRNNMSKLSQATVDNDAFKSILAGAGIDPNPRTGDKEGAQRVLELRNRVELTLGQMQQGQRREFSATEKQKVIQDIVNAEVLRPRSDFGQWVSGTKFNPPERMSNFKPGELNTAGVYVDVDGKRMPFSLSRIPTDEYAAVEQRLAREGVTPTPAAVAQAWYNFQRTKGKK
jgi:hypothetical protein